MGGSLLDLNNVGEVHGNLKLKMVGNVRPHYRIDGWFQGKWLEMNNQTLESKEGDFDAIGYGKTLTMNLEDGSVSGNYHEKSYLGYICQHKGKGEGCTKPIAEMESDKKIETGNFTQLIRFMWLNDYILVE